MFTRIKNLFRKRFKTTIIGYMSNTEIKDANRWREHNYEDKEYRFTSFYVNDRDLFGTDKKIKITVEEL